MRTFSRAIFTSLLVGGAACSQTPRRPLSETSARIDSLNAGLVDANRTCDPPIYAVLFTE